VYTTNFVSGSMTVSDLKVWFQTQLTAVSLGVVYEEGYGLVTRNHLSQFLMSDQFSMEKLNDSVKEIMIPNPLVVEADDPIDKLVPLLLNDNDRAEDFYNDLIVIEHDAFMGLVSPRELLSNYIEHVTHQLSAFHAQQKSLAQKNKRLFDSSFKQGFQESQVRAAFEETYTPILLFDDDGRLQVFNRRAVQVFEHTREIMESKMLYGDLLTGNFNQMWNLASQTSKLAGRTHADYMVPVTLKIAGGGKLEAHAYIRLSNDKKHMLINILEQPPEKAEELAEPTFSTPQPTLYEEPDMRASEEGRKPGKVTQAIRNKVDESHAMGLARSVATNLIDREASMDRLMEKLERIIKVAEQVEEISENTAEPAEEGSGPLLAGSLSNFSVIDLCQILGQGGKTGRLEIVNEASGGGAIYFNEGNMCHAAWAGNQGGLEDLRSLLATREGRFEFIVGEQPAYYTIEGDTMGLLIESCQYIDEHG
jgi:PAS domain-containing protein